ncbi:MAG: site-specific integrase [Muribaculaceae bacterium]|nr:site-specific integrase [Muribaculaceae bacterium]
MATIRKRGNSYQIRVSCGYDTKGNQIEQSMTWKPSPNMTERQIQKELNRVAVKFEESCMSGQVTANIKFEEFAETWFTEYANLNLRKTSLARTVFFKERTNAAIGHLRMDKITTRDVQKFINSLAQNGVNKKTGGALAHKTIKHYLSYISSIFDFAIKMQMLQNNPCRNVTIPKGSAKEREFYTVEEVEKLLKLLEKEDIKYRTFFNLAVYSGCRRSEFLGLEWKDIDFETGLVHIQRTSNYVAGEGMFEDTTVAGQLGHSSSNTTLGIYSHMFEEARVKSCNAITNALDFKKKSE